MANFEGYDRRIDKINAFLVGIGFECIDETRELCLEKGIDVAAIVRGIDSAAARTSYYELRFGPADALFAALFGAVVACVALIKLGVIA